MGYILCHKVSKTSQPREFKLPSHERIFDVFYREKYSNLKYYRDITKSKGMLKLLQPEELNLHSPRGSSGPFNASMYRISAIPNAQEAFDGHARFFRGQIQLGNIKRHCKFLILPTKNPFAPLPRKIGAGKFLLSGPNIFLNAFDKMDSYVEFLWRLRKAGKSYSRLLKSSASFNGFGDAGKLDLHVSRSLPAIVDQSVTNKSAILELIDYVIAQKKSCHFQELDNKPDLIMGINSMFKSIYENNLCNKCN